MDYNSTSVVKSSMKESDKEWMGVLPDGWSIDSIGRLCSSISSGGTPKATNPDYYADEGGVPFVSISDMSSTEYVFSTKKHLTSAGIDSKKLIIYPQGTLIYSMYATLGKISELQIPAAINQALLALVPKSTIDKDYMKYALMAMRDYVLSASNSNTQDNLNAEIVSHFKIPVPPFSHQKKIGQVLKKKCSGIDAIIDNLSIFITLLYECKQAIISEVITRGLDPNVTLKDSGIPWLGMISDSWDVTRLKYLVTTSTTKSSSYSAYLGLENVESWTGRYIDTGAISSREESVTIKTGNLCFSKLRPYLAKAIIAPFDGACSSEFIVFDHFKGDIRYLKYLMLTPNFIEEVNSSTYGTKMPRASWDFISSMYVPNVPIDEQIQISDYLDRVCNIIDSIVDSVKYSIIQIQQYKQSLVYEYVTGKRLVDVEVS